MTDHEKILASKRAKVAELDDANGETYNTIRAAAPDFGMDTTGVRLHMLIERLKTTFADEEFWLDFEIEFHESVKEALEPVLQKVQTAKQRSKLSVVKKPPSKLLGADGRPL